MGRNPTAEERKARMSERAIEGAKATEEYRAAERATIERIAGLQEARMALDSAAEQEAAIQNKIEAITKVARKKPTKKGRTLNDVL